MASILGDIDLRNCDNCDCDNCDIGRQAILIGCQCFMR